MTTLLEIATEALDDIGSIVVPSYLFTNPDDTAKQLIAIAKKVGREMVRDHDFQEMLSTGTVTTVAGTASYDLPAGYDRMGSDSTWDATNSRPMAGNTTSQHWAAITNAAAQTGVTYFYRLQGGKIQISPTPTSVWSFNYEYRSGYYCTDGSGTPKAAWTADTDLPRLPADLFIAGVLYYFQKGNNLPYEDAEAEYNAIIARRVSTNVPAGIINLQASVSAPGGDFCPPLNIPDWVSAP